MTNKELDAYHQPREVRPGCQHNLGCRCQTPYHLRESTPAERVTEEQYRQLGVRAFKSSDMNNG